MASSGKSSSTRGRRDDFWNYVPDPSRTVLYLLLAVAAFVASDWVPRLAEQMEQTRIEQRLLDSRDQMLADFERWRAQDPEYAQRVEEMIAQGLRQAELEAEGELQLAQPSTPMPMAGGEASTQPMLN
jgi:hypothetical protein